jgi:hypothetical protein
MAKIRKELKSIDTTGIQKEMKEAKAKIFVYINLVLK